MYCPGCGEELNDEETCVVCRCCEECCECSDREDSDESATEFQSSLDSEPARV